MKTSRSEWREYHLRYANSRVSSGKPVLRELVENRFRESGVIGGALFAELATHVDATSVLGQSMSLCRCRLSEADRRPLDLGYTG